MLSYLRHNLKLFKTICKETKMIKAFIFDMDGTLVHTEILKAMSYAKAAHELRPSLKEQEIIDAFKDVVGLSRKEVAQKLMERFSLENEASARMNELNVHQPWQAFVQLRMGIYDSMISDPEILNKHLTRDGGHKMDLLEKRWIVDSPPDLLVVVKRYISEKNEPQSKSK